MSNSATDPATVPQSLWAARGRHTGPAPEEILRRALRRRRDEGDIDDFAEPPPQEDSARRVFEARWRAGGTVTVRARLALVPRDGRPEGHEWTLVAEAERPWDDTWPSPATLFWPETGDDGDGGAGAWDHHPSVAGLRFRQVNALPTDDKEMRRRLRDAARQAWCVHVVVHEAMTPDERGRLPLTGLLPPGLRHRVVEHRAAPHQLRAVNWALKDFGVEVPRGGAVVLPGTPVPPGYDGQDFSVRNVFLDGSEPTELLATVTRYAAMPKPLPDGGEAAVTALREQWQLLTLEEELERERALVAMYAEALEAMTKSRDLYREAAERANEALAIYRENAPAPEPRTDPDATSPLQQLSRTFGRWKGTLRPPARDEDPDRQIS